jgi:hypothetical protein
MGAPQPVQATVVELWDIPFYNVRPQHTLIKSAATVVRDAEQADQVVPGGAYRGAYIRMPIEVPI